MAKGSQRFVLGGVAVRRGETADIRLKISERYTGDPISLPVRVIRGKAAGPTVFVTAAIHGEELNGVGIVHELMFSKPIDLARGTLILVPVMNIFGFESQQRYMPDRRDLNRSFPGSLDGSLTSRVARTLYESIVLRCDYGIDLHSAAATRTNYPNIRADLSVPSVRRIARAFGSELILNNRGPIGAFRREAVKAGCATIVLEAGEPLKIEPSVLEVGVRGVINVLRHLEMTEGELVRPAYQFRIKRSTWVRAQVGGILRFHVSPGEIVETGQAIATNASVFGESLNQLVSPVDGVVLGMTTLPTVKPGEPVCHLAVPNGSMRRLRAEFSRASRDSLHRRIRIDLAASLSVSEQEAAVAEDVERDEET